MIHTSEAKAVLLEALTDTAPERAARRGFAAAALYHWEQNDSEVIQALLEATDETDPGLARQAIHSLVGLNAKEAVERLSHLASNAEDERLRQKAKEGLGALQG